MPEDVTFWNQCSNCFASVPCGKLDLKYIQQWFTDQHVHDIGAVEYRAAYIIPGISMFIEHDPNILVNNYTQIADNRAGDYIEIKP